LQARISNDGCIDNRSELGHILKTELVEYIGVMILEGGKVNVFFYACGLRPELVEAS
jgi:hypothetical protein